MEFHLGVGVKIVTREKLPPGGNRLTGWVPYERTVTEAASLGRLGTVASAHPQSRTFAVSSMSSRRTRRRSGAKKKA